MKDAGRQRPPDRSRSRSARAFCGGSPHFGDGDWCPARRRRRRRPRPFYARRRATGPGLFAEHVLSCGDSRQSLRFVPLVGRADVDGVNGWVGKQVGDRGKRLRDTELVRVASRLAPDLSWPQRPPSSPVGRQSPGPSTPAQSCWRRSNPISASRHLPKRGVGLRLRLGRRADLAV